MNLSNEAKVGATALSAFLILAAIITFLGVLPFSSNSYPLTVDFAQVAGLKTGNAVRYAGVDVGLVDAVTPTGDGVAVRVKINKGVNIPENARFMIGTDGLLGEKFIDISPGDSKNMLAANSKVKGVAPRGLDQFMESSGNVMKKLENMADAFNNIFGDPKVQESLKETIHNTKEITANLNDFSRVMAKVAVQNEQEMNTMVVQISQMAVRLNSVAGRVDGMMADIDNNGQTARDVVVMLENMKSASARVENIAKSLEGVATDPKTADDIKATLHNARQASERANKMLDKFGNVKVSGSAETLYSSEARQYRSAAGVRLSAAGGYADMGVSDIGGGDRFNLLLGRQLDDSFSLRAGVVESEAGVGLEKRFGNAFTLGADAYDFNAFKIRLRGEWKLSDDLSLVGQSYGINRKDSNEAYVGVKYQF